MLFVWQPPGYSAPEAQDSWLRFLDVNGTVETEAVINPDDLAMPVKPQPLDAFLRSAGLSS